MTILGFLYNLSVNSFVFKETSKINLFSLVVINSFVLTFITALDIGSINLIFFKTSKLVFLKLSL